MNTEDRLFVAATRVDPPLDGEVRELLNAAGEELVDLRHRLRRAVGWRSWVRQFALTLLVLIVLTLAEWLWGWPGVLIVGALGLAACVWGLWASPDDEVY